MYYLRFFLKILKLACKDTKNISRAQIIKEKSEKKLLFLAYVRNLL